jgi:hypothetical protein
MASQGKCLRRCQSCSSGVDSWLPASDGLGRWTGLLLTGTEEAALLESGFVRSGTPYCVVLLSKIISGLRR